MSLKWMKIELLVLKKGLNFSFPILTPTNEMGHFKVNIKHANAIYYFSLPGTLSFLLVEESIFSMQKPFQV